MRQIRRNSPKPIHLRSQYGAPDALPKFVRDIADRIKQYPMTTVSPPIMTAQSATDIRFTGGNTLRHGGGYANLVETTPVTAFLSMGQTRILRLAPTKPSFTGADLKLDQRILQVDPVSKDVTVKRVRSLNASKILRINVPMPHNTMVIASNSLLGANMLRHSIDYLKGKSLRKGEHHQLKICFGL